MSRASGASESSIDWFWQTRRAHFGRERASARLERRVLHHFVRLHSEGGAGEHGKQGERSPQGGLAEPAHHHCAGCASERAPAFALTAAPKRRRRSASDSAPPNAIAAPPSQISVTRGFQ